VPRTGSVVLHIVGPERPMGLPGELNTKYLRWRGAAILPSHVMLLVTSSMASFGWPLDFLYNFFMSQGHDASVQHLYV